MEILITLKNTKLTSDMKKVTTARSDYLAYFYLPHDSVQCIYEEWDIPINVHRHSI